MTSDERLLHLLRQVHCFSGLDDNKLRLLREGMQLEVFEPGAIICREGESGDRMFVIESGEVAVLKAGEAGATIEITVLQAGEIAGELSLFGEGIRSATLQARTRAALWVLKHDDFEGLVEAHGELATGLFATLSRHLSRQNSVMARLLSRDIDPRLKIAFFDTKPYMQTAFAEANRYDYAITFYEPRLSEETVSMAAGFPVVCVFVNDSLTASAVDELAALGVEMIALRCAGYNNVDLAACERNGVSVARVPAYSPFAVAEHAVSLMMTLNRRVHRAYNRVRDGNFSLRGLVGFDMHGKTAGIVGAGQIGRCVLRILAGFGCR